MVFTVIRRLVPDTVSSRTALLLVVALLWQSLSPVLTLAALPYATLAEAGETTAHCAEPSVLPPDDCCAEHAPAATCYGECGASRLVVVLPSPTSSLMVQSLRMPLAERKPDALRVRAVDSLLRPPISA